MTTTPNIHARIAPVAFLAVALAAVNWYFAPRFALVWLAEMGSMAICWILPTVLAWSGRPQSESERNFLGLSVVLSGLMIIGSQGLTLAVILGFAHGNFVLRGVGVMIGAVFATIGNALPKVLGPLTATRCSPAQAQRLQRLSGWAFVIAGLGWMAAWIFAPIAQAATIAITLCGAIVVVVFLRSVLVFVPPRRGSSSM